MGQLKQYVVWGSITGDPELDGQEVKTFSNKGDAEAYAEELNDDPKNHPDLCYWVEEE